MLEVVAKAKQDKERAREDVGSAEIEELGR